MPWFEHEFDRKKLQKNCAKKLHFRKLHRKSRWAVKIILDEAFVLRKILKMQWNIYGIGIFSHRKVTFWGFYYYKSTKKCFAAKKVPRIMPLWANFLQQLFQKNLWLQINCCYILLQLCNFSWSQNHHMCSLRVKHLIHEFWVFHVYFSNQG